MALKILIGTLAAAISLVSFVATRPSSFHIERSVTIAAPAPAAFGLVNDLRSWRSWSPFEDKDPAMARTYQGSASGRGAVYAWAGTSAVGKGRMTIRRSDAPSLVALDLEFFEPMQGNATATFTFVPDPAGTKVTWAMDGRNDFVGKAMSLVMDTDALLGAEFERGLAKLKSAAESAPKPAGEVARTAGE